ncbi:hypothetical protein BT69DRAFT_1297269 [Atractiella rhizophila]|nr:hypothetical protein BT69DRAFT_1297269 [Atractiella rhizophila]
MPPPSLLPLFLDTFPQSILILPFPHITSPSNICSYFPENSPPPPQLLNRAVLLTSEPFPPIVPVILLWVPARMSRHFKNPHLCSYPKVPVDKSGKPKESSEHLLALKKILKAGCFWA